MLLNIWCSSAIFNLILYFINERNDLMKKICIFIVAMLLLQSCSSSSVVNETSDHSGRTGEESSDSGSGEIVDNSLLSDLQFDAQPGVSITTLAHTTDITSFKTDEEIAQVNTSPVIYSDGQYTYVFRRFPEELKGADQVMEYMRNEDIGEINEIEIYENNDYSQPVEVITLDAMQEKSFRPHGLNYDSEKEEFYVYISESGEPICYTFSRQGELLNRCVFTSDRVDALLCLDGFIYEIDNDGYKGRTGNLSVIDPQTDKSTKLDEGVLCFYTENGLLYYIKSTRTADYRNIQRICSYDPATGTITNIKDIQTEESVISFYYDISSDIVYFTSTIEMFACKDGEVMPVMNTYKAALSICEADNENIYVKVGLNQISVYQLTDEPGSLDEQVEVLKVCIAGEKGEFEAPLNSALELMTAVGLPVRFEYTYIAENSSIRDEEAEYVNNMAKKLLAEDTDYDIFIVNSTMPELFDGKYYEDYSQYPVIKDYFDKMIPGMADLCTIDGKLALAPVYMYVDSLNFTPQTLADPKKAPKTFDEFFSKYDELTENLGDDYYCKDYAEVNFISAWLNELASNYFSEVISDETAEKDLLRLYECAEGLDEYEKIYIGEDYNDKSARFMYYINPGSKSAGERNNWVAWPKLGEKYKYSVEGRFMAVNPNSPNKELALKCITYYLNSIVTGEMEGNMHYFEKDAIEASEDVVSREIDYGTSKYTSFKEQIANSIHKTAVDDLFITARDLCIQIEEGTTTPEEAATKTMRYLKMMRDE